MRLKIFAVLACALSMAAAAASASTTVGWYVAADVGVHEMCKHKLVLHDVTLLSRDEGEVSGSGSSSSLSAEPTSEELIEGDLEESGNYALDTKAKAAAFVRTGYQFNRNWRAELEYGERPGDIETSIFENVDSGESYDVSGGRGSLDLTSLMVNLLYDVAPDRRLHPFVGVGVGAVRIDADYTGGYTAPDVTETYTMTSKQTVGAAQLIAGLAFSASDRLHVDLTYRYLETAKAKYNVRLDTSYYDDDSGCESYECGEYTYASAYGTFVEEVYEGRFSGKIRDHSLTLGVRWSFGAPRGPMADVGPPPEDPVSSPRSMVAAYDAPPPPVVRPIKAAVSRKYTVYFPFNSASPTADGQAVMSQAAQAASDQPGTPVVVTGHADTSGGAAYNVKLSQKRARMVADGLIQLGVPASAISTDWKGEAQPAVATGDGIKKAENRRATITLGQ